MRTSTRIASTVASAAVLASVLNVGTAGAQTPTSGFVPSIGVSPADAKPDDPNGGQWFVFDLEPGKSGGARARVANPAKVPQNVRIYFRDMVFNADGTPVLNDNRPQEEIGLWGRVGGATVRIPAMSTIVVPFTVTVPMNAEPGDHLGAVVVEGEAQGAGAIKTVTRVSTRLYVTVPGDATKSYEIIKVTKALDSFWFPGRVDVTTVLRNTGRIRVHPTVSVGGTHAEGAPVLLSRSVEEYQGDVKVPFWGGPVDMTVRSVTDEGLTRIVKGSMFVIPWGLLALIVLGGLILTGITKVWRMRRDRVRKLQRDLRRLEELVAQGGTDRPAKASAPDDADDLVRAIKRARRSGAEDRIPALALELHDRTGNALETLLDAFATPSDLDADMVAAIAGYGARASASDRLARLPEPRQALVVAAVGGRRRRTPVRTSSSS